MNKRFYDERQHYSIRKLTVGAASVLIGTSLFWLGGQNVIHADIQSGSNDSTELVEKTSKNNASPQSNSDNANAQNQSYESKVASQNNQSDSNVASSVENKQAQNTPNASSVQGNPTDQQNSIKTNKDIKIPASPDQDKLKIKQNSSLTDNKVSQDIVNSKNAGQKQTNDTSEQNNTNPKAKVTSSSANADNSNTLDIKKIKSTGLTPQELAESKVSDVPVSVTSDDGKATLSIDHSVIGNIKNNNSIKITLTATGNNGDTFSVTVPKGIAYTASMKAQMSANGTSTFKENNDSYILSGKFNHSLSGQTTLEITLTNSSNGVGQGNLINSSDFGDVVKHISWQWNKKNQKDIPFDQIVKPEMKPTFSRTMPPTTSEPNILPNVDYTYSLYINEKEGIGNDNITSGRINSADNYGTTITIPVPENFVLNADRTKIINDFGDTDYTTNSGNKGDETTITQDGEGADIIITVPKRSGNQDWYGSNHPYQIVGHFDIPTLTPGEHIYNSNRQITIVQKLCDSPKGRSDYDDAKNDPTEYLTGVAGPFQEKIVNANDTSDKGPIPFNTVPYGAIVSNKLMLDNDKNDDPTIVNYFFFNNPSKYDFGTGKNQLQIHLILNIANGLNATSVKVPSIDNINMPGTTSYSYVMELADGSTKHGTVDAGNKVVSSGKPIRKIMFTPNYLAVGATTNGWSGIYPDPTDPTKQPTKVNGFLVYGNLAHMYDDGKTPVKLGDTLDSSISATTGSNYTIDEKPGDTKHVLQTVITPDDENSALGVWHNENFSDGSQDWISVYENESDLSKETAHDIVDPIFYYVLPKCSHYANKTNGLQGNPKITTFTTNDGRQVVKLDYIDTGFKFNTDEAANCWIYLKNNPDATDGSYPWDIYVYSPNSKMLNDNYESALKNNTAFSQTTTDYPKNPFNLDWVEGHQKDLYRVGGDSWKIAHAAELAWNHLAQGNMDISAQKHGTSIDSGSPNMTYEVSIFNETPTEYDNNITLINLPTAGDKYGNQFTFKLTGPVKFANNDDNKLAKILYSCYPGVFVGDKNRPDDSGYVSNDEVKDWSKVRSIAVEIKTIPAKKTFSPLLIQGQDPTIADDAGKTAGITTNIHMGGKNNAINDEFSTQTCDITVISHPSITFVDDDSNEKEIADGLKVTSGLDQNNPGIISFKNANDIVNNHTTNASDVVADLLNKGYIYNGTHENDGNTKADVIIGDKDLGFSKAGFPKYRPKDPDQKFIVHFKHEITDEKDQTATVNEKVIYYYENGPKAGNDAPEAYSKITPITFTYTGVTKDNVTGEKSYTNCNISSGFAEIPFSKLAQNLKGTTDQTKDKDVYHLDPNGIFKITNTTGMPDIIITKDKDGSIGALTYSLKNDKKILVGYLNSKSSDATPEIDIRVPYTLQEKITVHYIDETKKNADSKNGNKFNGTIHDDTTFDDGEPDSSVSDITSILSVISYLENHGYVFDKNSTNAKHSDHAKDGLTDADYVSGKDNFKHDSLATIDTTGKKITLKFDNDEDPSNQEYFIYFYHHTTSEADQTAMVKEKVTYYYENGPHAGEDVASPTYSTITPITFTRTVTKDDATGDLIYGTWTINSSFAEIPFSKLAPTLNGTTDQTKDKAVYQLDYNGNFKITKNTTGKPNIVITKGSIGSLTYSAKDDQNLITQLAGNSPEIDIKVPYKLQKKIIVHYIDENTGKKIDPSVVKSRSYTGDPDTSSNYNNDVRSDLDKLTDLGYIYDSGRTEGTADPAHSMPLSTYANKNQYKFTDHITVIDDKDHQTFKLSDLKFDDNEKLDDQNYYIFLYHGKKSVIEHSSVTENVYFRYENGLHSGDVVVKHPDKHVTVHYSRTGTYDATKYVNVTPNDSEIIWSTWTPDKNQPSFTSITIPVSVRGEDNIDPKTYSLDYDEVTATKDNENVKSDLITTVSKNGSSIKNLALDNKSETPTYNILNDLNNGYTTVYDVYVPYKLQESITVHYIDENVDQEITKLSPSENNNADLNKLADPKDYTGGYPANDEDSHHQPTSVNNETQSVINYLKTLGYTFDQAATEGKTAIDSKDLKKYNPATQNFNSDNKWNASRLSFDNDENPKDQVYYVYFYHTTTLKADQTASVNEKVTYYYENGPHAGDNVALPIYSTITPITFTRTSTQDEVTGNISHGTWTIKGSFADIQFRNLPQNLKGTTDQTKTIDVYSLDSDNIQITKNTTGKTVSIANGQIDSLTYDPIKDGNMITSYVGKNPEIDIKVPYKLQEKITVHYIDETTGEEIFDSHLHNNYPAGTASKDASYNYSEDTDSKGASPYSSTDNFTGQDLTFLESKHYVLDKNATLDNSSVKQDLKDFLAKNGLKLNLDTDNFKGQTSSNPHLNGKNIYSNTKLIFDNDENIGNQNFYVYLKHDTKVGIDQTATVNEKVTYFYENGPHAGNVITSKSYGSIPAITFTRSTTEDEITGKIVKYGTWKISSGFAKIPFTAFPKNLNGAVYSLDKDNITITKNTTGKTVNVANGQIDGLTYDPTKDGKTIAGYIGQNPEIDIMVPYKLQEKITVHYIDETNGKEIKHRDYDNGDPYSTTDNLTGQDISDLNGKYYVLDKNATLDELDNSEASQKLKQSLASNGYNLDIKNFKAQDLNGLTANGYSDAKLVFDNDETPDNQNFYVYLGHKTTNIKEQKQINEIIKYVEKGNPTHELAPEYKTNPITFSRSYTFDYVTGDIIDDITTKATGIKTITGTGQMDKNSKLTVTKGSLPNWSTGSFKPEVNPLIDRAHGATNDWTVDSKDATQQLNGQSDHLTSITDAQVGGITFTQVMINALKSGKLNEITIVVPYSRVTNPGGGGGNTPTTPQPTKPGQPTKSIEPTAPTTPSQPTQASQASQPKKHKTTVKHNKTKKVVKHHKTNRHITSRPHSEKKRFINNVAAKHQQISNISKRHHNKVTITNSQPHSINVKNVNNVVKPHSAAKVNTKSTALPQTGENNSQKLALIGLVVTELSGLIALYGGDRRKKKN